MPGPLELSLRRVTGASGGDSRIQKLEAMTDDAAAGTHDSPTDLGVVADAMTEADQQMVDELAAADVDYAAGDTISGEELRRRFGLPQSI